MIMLPLLLFACGGTPDAFESRPPLPSCGRYDERSSARAAVAARNECFLRALAGGRRAELAVTRGSAETGIVTTYFRALGRGRVELFIDGTEDESYGRWLHAVCRRVDETRGVLRTAGCRPLSLSSALEP
jgi:hypothetical protein